MKRWVWVTAVSLIAFLFAIVGCGAPDGASDSEAEALPEISGPAFVFFYTDN
jgi:hypothetical protein